MVKEVPSGDQIVVMAATKGGGIPPEKRLTLSSLQAPKLVRHSSLEKNNPPTQISSVITTKIFILLP